MTRRSTSGELGDARPTEASAIVAAWIAAGGEALASALAGDRGAELESVWGWRVEAVGGERRAAAAAWAARFGAAEPATLREVAGRGTSLVLILGQAAQGVDDVRLLLDGERSVAMSTPMPLPDAIQLGEGLGRVHMLPSFRRSEAFRLAAPMLQELREGSGEQQSGIATLSVRLRSAPGDRTVDAMLAEACEIVGREFDAIESAIAVGRPPLAVGDVRALVGVLRDATGRLASIDLADTGGWAREVEWLGPAGRIRVEDSLIRRWDQSGDLVERIDVRGAKSSLEAAIESLRALAVLRIPRDDPAAVLNGLATTEAVRLSVRTGNWESPSRVRELASRP